ncbi:class I SAM-dependent methyltransferase [Pontibacillus litoralis]|uniref:16S RNA G1207 methylase RsmC n=1 Tax=Pontibacillus litoralis JSM 072002 TaxID=1385512 RepID=A0A0A5HP39_9BACI|nr:class I SAM-dependent methyltransferase [Pontibacillus litoralis]KGX85392.1 16S RNA G1207 methylase RsmC [Pontibacillus litoralis JSM 072002]
MTEHYYSKKPGTNSAPKQWTFKLRGKNLRFTTDHGVFSKDEVDFGSRTLLEVFREPDVQGDFLDLGCGYGPIGIALGIDFPQRRVVMVDVNERALELAQQNACNNNAANVELVASDQFEAISKRDFAAIVTNPPIRAGKKVVHSMLEQSHRALLPKGELWVVIQKKQGAPSAKALLNELFPEVEVVVRNKGYYVFKAVKD